MNNSLLLIVLEKKPPAVSWRLKTQMMKKILLNIEYIVINLS